MSSVLREGAGEASGASATSAEAQVPTGHLVRCPKCRALNGRAVSTCWSCESDLYTLLQPGADLMPEANAVGQDTDRALPKAQATATSPRPSAPSSKPGVLDISVLLGEAAAAKIDASGLPLDPPVPKSSLNLGGFGSPSASAYASSYPGASAYASTSARPGVPFARSAPPPWVLPAIAAAVVLLLAGGAYLFFSNGDLVPRRPASRDPALSAASLSGGTNAPGQAGGPSDGLSRVDDALRAADAAAAASPPPDDTLSPSSPTTRTKKTGAGRHAKSRHATPSTDLRLLDPGAPAQPTE